VAVECAVQRERAGVGAEDPTVTGAAQPGRSSVRMGGWPTRPSATSAWRWSPASRVPATSELPLAPAAALDSPAKDAEAPNPVQDLN
jgi:hypothetical protein